MSRETQQGATAVALNHPSGVVALNHNPSTEQTVSFKQCQICSDQATGRHFGVLACEGCKGFFRRNIQKNAKFICFYNNNCDVYGIKKRKCCQKCRMDRCLSAGMNPLQIKKNNLTPRSKTRRIVKPKREGEQQHALPVFPFDKSADYKRSCWLSARYSDVMQLDRAAVRRSTATSPTSNIMTQTTSGCSTTSTRSNSDCSSRPSVIRKEYSGRVYMIDPTTQSEILASADVPHRANSIIPGRQAQSLNVNRAASLPPRKLFQLRFDRQNDQLMLREEEDKPTSKTADPITRLIFKNITSSMGECFDLCKSSPYFTGIDVNDQQVLFDKSVYELIIVYTYYQNKLTIRKVTLKSNTMMTSLIDALEKCEINTWNEVKMVMMLSVLSYDRLQNVNVLRDVELVKSLKTSLQDELSSTFVGGDCMPRFVNVIMLMAQLRELNEYWTKCDLDKSGIPIEVEKTAIKFM